TTPRRQRVISFALGHTRGSRALGIHDVYLQTPNALTNKGNPLVVRRPHGHVVGREVVGQFGLPRPVGIHDVDLATEIRHATPRERDPASVMRPVGPCVVPGDVGELSLVRATLCHDIDVEGAYAVIS